MNIVLLLFVCPIFIIMIALSRTKLLPVVGAVLFWVQMALVFWIITPYLQISETTPDLEGIFRLDKISALFIILTTVVAAAAYTHAIVFFKKEKNGSHPPTSWQVSRFYIFASLFTLAMYGVVAAENLGYLWVSLEATTLFSTPLVYYHGSKTSIEAAWKYLIICSVEIAFALFGIAIFFNASQQSLTQGSLSISVLIQHAKLLPPILLRFGFLFMILGFGTKAGLFPLHSWLPDAHSEAAAPASAMLSGALLNCALVALWRLRSILIAAGQEAYLREMLLPLGLLTVLAASLFLFRQRNLKRLLAYSSMENVGLMAVAIALGSSAGFTLQAINHSLVKVGLFLIAGNLLQDYKTQRMTHLRALLSKAPVQAVLMLLLVFAVAGTPPFGGFLSEWQILMSAVGAHAITAIIVLVAGLAIAFIALSIHLGAMLFGEAHPEPEHPRSNGSGILVPAFLLLISLALGVALTPNLMTLLSGAP